MGFAHYCRECIDKQGWTWYGGTTNPDEQIACCVCGCHPYHLQFHFSVDQVYRVS